MPSPTSSSRRDFLKKMAATSALSTIGTTLLGQNTFALHRIVEPERPLAPSDRIRIGTVGMGIIGFIDTDTALRVPGVELVAAADTYSSRRAHVKEVYGGHVDTYTDYRELLARDDIDAVLLCVPDHWHARMSIDAMKAGKAVYCEKPMTKTIAEGSDVIAAAKATGVVFQVGSQYASSILYQKAEELIRTGAIGKLNAVETRLSRNSSIGAWQYSIPRNASPETCDWDLFLGNAPKRPFDATRYFRWRNYRDYGTAAAGDLYVHLFTGIHRATGALGPETIMALGGLRYWDDGRDVYDVIMGLCNYPETPESPGFTLTLSTNFADGGGEDWGFRFVGSDGQITVGWTDLTLTQAGIVQAEQHTAEEVLHGYNAVRTWAVPDQEEYARWWYGSRPAPAFRPPLKAQSKFLAPDGYDDRYDHFVNFFNAVRDGAPVYEDAVFGLRAAGPALLCNESYFEGKPMVWDPANLKRVG